MLPSKDRGRVVDGRTGDKVRHGCAKGRGTGTKGTAGFDMQATIRSDVSFSGVGLHTGRLTRMTIRPHAANMGLWFRRMDLPGRPTDRRAL
jgi:hypothetical protein